MNKLEFNKPYLLSHFLSNVDKLMQNDEATLEGAVAQTLLPIRQLIISAYTTQADESNKDELGGLAVDTFWDIGNFLISAVTNIYKRELDNQKIRFALNQLSAEDRIFFVRNEDMLVKYTANWDKSRELDNFKNNKFSEN